MKNQPRVVLVVLHEENKITHAKIIRCVVTRFEACSLPDTLEVVNINLVTKKDGTTKIFFYNSIYLSVN